MCSIHPARGFPLSALLALMSLACWAQEATVEDSGEDVLEAMELDKIQVTGSHLKRTDYEGPQPVIVFDRQYLQATGFQNITDFARYLPQSHQTLNESWGQYTTGVPEASQFNLRGLGADSTLTLVNGMRVAPYGQSLGGDPFADISAIPMSAVDRIEILKDGASAIYGSDAVAGVVNIILREDFDGTEASGGYQVTAQGDNAEWNADLYHGGQTGDFHYLLGLSYQDREPLYNRDRTHSADPDYRPVGGYNFRSPNSSPATVLRYDTFAFDADPACGTDPLIANIDVDPVWGDVYCMFNYNQYDMMYIERQRASANLKAGYRFNNGMHLVADVLYSRKDSFDQLAQTPIAGALLDTFTGRPVVLADHPDNPFGTDVEIFYRVMDAGQRQMDATSRQHRLLLGLEGMTGRWDWRVNLMDSGNRFRKDLPNSVLMAEFQEALLGRGGPNQDQYYNPFGWMPQNDPAVIERFVLTASEGSDTTEQAAEITASTSFGLLPGGPVAAALGGQWRHQQLEEFADEASAQGRIAGRSADFLIPRAERDITAVYAEFSLPVLASLEMQLAARYEDYSDFGTTTNPKIALRWQPWDQLVLRASWGTSFHAPDFLDLYQNPVQSLGRFIDTPRCEVTGLAEDCEPALYEVLDQGNPYVQPETGESWYGGIVWAPPFVPNLELSLEYWRYDYDERIYWIGGQYVLDNYPVDTPRIERAPQTPEEAAAGVPGRILLVHFTADNLATMDTAGVDLDLSYRWPTRNAGEFAARLDYTYTDQWDVALPEEAGNTEYILAGWYWDGPIPRNRGNLALSWHLGRHDLNGTFRYAGSYKNWMEFLPVDGQESDIPFIVEDHLTLDVQYAYHFDALGGATLRVGCQNCSDEDPPFTHDTGGEDIHDRRGLIWYANWTQPF